MRLVRILRSTVMVRVGGGWVALDEFLQKNDPCRGKLKFQKEIYLYTFFSCVVHRDTHTHVSTHMYTQVGRHSSHTLF